MTARFSELHGCLRNRNQLLITLVTLLAPLSIATASTMPFSGSTSGFFLSPNFDEKVVGFNGNIEHRDVSQLPPFYQAWVLTRSSLDRASMDCPAAVSPSPAPHSAEYRPIPIALPLKSAPSVISIVVILLILAEPCLGSPAHEPRSY